MRDYQCIAGDGSTIKVADLPTWAIHEQLKRPIHTSPPDSAFAEAVRERLCLELFIREMGLRK